MKNCILILTLLIASTLSYGQESNSGIVLTTDKIVDNSDIRRLLKFEGIQFLKMSFHGDELVNKSYRITVKEIWDGEIKSESDVVNSIALPVENHKRINDTIFTIDIISKLTLKNKLKMSFHFPGFTTERQFDAIESDNYSLRNLAEVNKTTIEPGKKFYFLAYILPYEKDGVSYWCAVENSGKVIENWGKEFGIKHYLVFEMIFE